MPQFFCQEGGEGSEETEAQLGAAQQRLQRGGVRVGAAERGFDGLLGAEGWGEGGGMDRWTSRWTVRRGRFEGMRREGTWTDGS